MKALKYIISTFLLVFIAAACSEEDFGSTEFLKTATAPTNVSALFEVTQDNTGVVTITPNGEGAVSYDVFYGDTTTEPVKLKQGESTSHTYLEGNYDVKIIAYGITGLKAEATKPLAVSFKAPEVLEVLIANDEATSKKVNVTVTANYAISYDVYFGEEGNDEPVTVNVGEAASYVYQEAGTYTITVKVKGTAIATTEKQQSFEVTAILQPTAAAPTPPIRNEADYISIFSDTYTNEAGTDYFPDWGQGGQGSSWGELDLSGDKMLQYIKISYQGIQFGTPVDVSNMEYLHLDVWTADVEKLETSLISVSNGEKPVVTELTKDGWTSIDIPISAFTDQGLTVADIQQLKFVGTPWAGGTVFIDNIYFYKSPSDNVGAIIQNFEGTPPTFTAFGNIANVEVVDNPDATGKNTTNKVAKMIKTAGSEVWAGAFFETSAIDFSTHKKIGVKVWSPKAGATVKLKIENADASIAHEVDVNTTTANAWEELVFDFSAAPAADYVKVVIFFDFGNAGDDSIYYYDEIQLMGEGGNSVASLVYQDFEATAPTFTVFGNIGDIEVIDNPDASEINTSAKVAKMTKTNGSEVWAGAFFENSPLDFTTYKKISVKVWSPKSGIVVKLKLENADGSTTHEVDVNTTTANAWEELVFDFSTAPTADYVKTVLFFDFGNAGDDTVYYYDDFTLTN